MHDTEYRTTTGEREAITITVDSFSARYKSYEVTLFADGASRCDCPRGTCRGDCEKHPALARALEAYRERAARMFYVPGPAGREMVEERIHELCRAIFAPLGKPYHRFVRFGREPSSRRDGFGRKTVRFVEHVADSAALVDRVNAEHYATAEIKARARERHLAVMERCYGETGGAA